MPAWRCAPTLPRRQPHHDPDDIDVKTICHSLHPQSYNATAPNQKRLAVVSAPVTDGRGERADERLNAALGKALKMMQEKVKEKGFKDNWVRTPI